MARNGALASCAAARDSAFMIRAIARNFWVSCWLAQASATCLLSVEEWPGRTWAMGFPHEQRFALIFEVDTKELTSATKMKAHLIFPEPVGWVFTVPERLGGLL